MKRFNGLHEDFETYNNCSNNNCYTYAINQPTNPYTHNNYESYMYCQPGKLGGKEIENREDLGLGNMTRAIEYARFDLLNLGYEMIESTYDEYIEDQNTWKVAFCHSDWDYHWYRQNVDGTWSHKAGQTEVSHFDKSGNIIYNPETCNRGIYEKFIGFYIIKKTVQ